MCEPMVTKTCEKENNDENTAKERVQYSKNKLLLSCPKKVNTFKDPLAKCKNCRQNSDFNSISSEILSPNCQTVKCFNCNKLYVKPFYPSFEEYIQKYRNFSLSCLN